MKLGLNKHSYAHKKNTSNCTNGESLYQFLGNCQKHLKSGSKKKDILKLLCIFMYMLCSETISNFENGTENNTENVIVTLCKHMLNPRVEYCVQYSKERTRKAREQQR